MLRQFLIILTIVIIFIAVYFPTRHARHYNYIALQNIANELDLRKPIEIDYNLKNCTYHGVVLNNEDINIDSVYVTKTFNKTFIGGEYKPSRCLPLIKTALIVPYRSRPNHLNIFLNYMHSFLQRQNIHYRIFIVDQNDTSPFNRAKMLNFGATEAMKHKYNCLILHDVDLIPINTGNIYGCTKVPRHMSSSLDTFRYNLPYLTLFGGAAAISSEHFKKVHGMSNKFYGWGGEDDDFYRRLVQNDLEPCRFPPEISRYIMLPHEKQKASENRFKLLEESEQNQKTDGISSLSQNYIVKLEDLYTHIIVS
ncbi:unnamed protein product [Phaedon cochleariae]|uniref:Beta-1,4-N-acetylgalactosaminyltransferase n=1 Tax=Phaedon cochleariae TaxID=80249 RepID=A0A9P0GXH3_PHACE|nr:unnamed protein product [Phaedon cochleariae]